MAAFRFISSENQIKPSQKLLIRDTDYFDEVNYLFLFYELIVSFAKQPPYGPKNNKNMSVENTN